MLDRKNNAGAPAFPVFDPKAPASDFEWVGGLTKREAAAIAAMQGMLAHPAEPGLVTFSERIELAVRSADQLLDELHKETDMPECNHNCDCVGPCKRGLDKSDSPLKDIPFKEAAPGAYRHRPSDEALRFLRDRGGVDEAMPLSISVPVCNMTEPDLMAALEAVVEHWPRDTLTEKRAISRAVTWLCSKYGEIR